MMWAAQQLYVLDENGEQWELTAEGPIVSASLNNSGMLAVTSQVSGTKGLGRCVHG